MISDGWSIAGLPRVHGVLHLVRTRVLVVELDPLACHMWKLQFAFPEPSEGGRLKLTPSCWMDAMRMVRAETTLTRCMAPGTH